MGRLGLLAMFVIGRGVGAAIMVLRAASPVLEFT